MTHPLQSDPRGVGELSPKLRKQINRHFGKSNKQKLKDAVKARAGK